MPTEGRTRATVPLFQLFTIEQLTRLTPYSVSYLDALLDSRQPIRPRFKRVVSRILGRPESELFDCQDDHATPANGAAIGTTPTSEVAS